MPQQPRIECAGLGPVAGGGGGRAPGAVQAGVEARGRVVPRAPHRVITSYSIHYTKLYEGSQLGAQGRVGQPQSRCRRRQILLGVLGSLQAMEALKLLAGYGEPSYNFV